MPVHTYRQAGLDSAVAALHNAVIAHGLQDQLLSSLYSGVLRIEVPLPRGCTALRWLQGQAGNNTAVGPACSHLVPHLYFSGRHSSAPDTPESARAEECTRGWTAVAGVCACMCMAGGMGGKGGGDEG